MHSQCFFYRERKKLEKFVCRGLYFYLLSSLLFKTFDNNNNKKQSPHPQPIYIRNIVGNTCCHNEYPTNRVVTFENISQHHQNIEPLCGYHVIIAFVNSSLTTSCLQLPFD